MYRGYIMVLEHCVAILLIAQAEAYASFDSPRSVEASVRLSASLRKQAVNLPATIHR